MIDCDICTYFLFQFQNEVHSITYHCINFCSQIINETIPALQKLKEAGKIRFIGITGLPLGIFSYVLDRVPLGTVDVVLSYCHYGINDTTLEDLLPYLKSKGVGVISASPLAMGLLTESGPPEWHPASPELKVLFKIKEFMLMINVISITWGSCIHSLWIIDYSFSLYCRYCVLPIFGFWA